MKQNVFSASRASTAVACFVALISLCWLFASMSVAQPVSASAAPPLTAAQLDRLVAPIALYPDPLIAQILMAATYPLEVVEADRWLRLAANATLRGDALTAALPQQSWDPSVKSLVAFPQLVHTMNINLNWTEQLGDAFLAQQLDVMDAIQRLRQRAQTAGSLASTPQQVVSTDDQEITIEPVNPDMVYVPTFDPWCVYRGWPSSDYPPFYFASGAGNCVPGELIAFGAAFTPFSYWAWGHFDWRHHTVRVDHDRFQRLQTGGEPPGEIWQHDRTHRHGVPYRDSATAARFLGPTGEAGLGYRGFSPAPAVVAPAQPEVPSIEREPAAIIRAPTGPALPQRPVPPAFESYGQGAQVRSEAARGFSSRMAPTLSMPAPSFHAAPMPSFPAAPMQGFHGGGGRR
jgi:hypothetical protein